MHMHALTYFSRFIFSASSPKSNRPQITFYCIHMEDILNSRQTHPHTHLYIIRSYGQFCFFNYGNLHVFRVQINTWKRAALTQGGHKPLFKRFNYDYVLLCFEYIYFYIYLCCDLHSVKKVFVHESVVVVNGLMLTMWIEVQKGRLV